MYLLGRDEQQKIKEWDNETIRYFLVLKSAGFKEAVSILREKHDFKNKSYKKNQEKLFNAELLNTPLLNKDINEITDFFDIKRHFVEAAISGKGIRDLSVLEFYSQPVYTEPTTDNGFYIKVSPYTSKAKVLKAYEFIKSTFRKWEKDPEIEGNPKIHDRSTKPKNIIKLATLFCAIEKMIYDNYQYEKEQKNNGSSRSSNMNQIYEEEGRKSEFSQKKNESNKKYIARIRNVYLVDILKYFSLPRFNECKELFKSLRLYPTS